MVTMSDLSSVGLAALFCAMVAFGFWAYFGRTLMSGIRAFLVTAAVVALAAVAWRPESWLGLALLATAAIGMIAAEAAYRRHAVRAARRPPVEPAAPVDPDRDLFEIPPVTKS